MYHWNVNNVWLSLNPLSKFSLKFQFLDFFYNSVADQVKYANESQPKSTHKKAHTKAVLHKKKKVVNKSLYDTSAKIIKVTSVRIYREE